MWSLAKIAASLLSILALSYSLYVSFSFPLFNFKASFLFPLANPVITKWPSDSIVASLLLATTFLLGVLISNVYPLNQDFHPDSLLLVFLLYDLVSVKSSLKSVCPIFNTLGVLITNSLVALIVDILFSNSFLALIYPDSVKIFPPCLFFSVSVSSNRVLPAFIVPPLFSTC